MSVRMDGPAWLADIDAPEHGERNRQALAQAIVEHGRSRQGQHALMRAIMDDSARGGPWLRAFIVQLNAEG
jgi:hypothetical protein